MFTRQSDQESRKKSHESYINMWRKSLKQPKDSATRLLQTEEM